MNVYVNEYNTKHILGIMDTEIGELNCIKTKYKEETLVYMSLNDYLYKKKHRSLFCKSINQSPEIDW